MLPCQAQIPECQVPNARTAWSTTNPTKALRARREGKPEVRIPTPLTTPFLKQIGNNAVAIHTVESSGTFRNPKAHYAPCSVPCAMITALRARGSKKPALSTHSRNPQRFQMPTDFSTIDLATLNAAQGVMVAALRDRCCQWNRILPMLLRGETSVLRQ
jgi:hypothetical protein